MRDNETDGGGMGTVDAQTAPVEPEQHGFDVTEEWPQLPPLELAVCLADSDRRRSSTPMSRPR